MLRKGHDGLYQAPIKEERSERPGGEIDQIITYTILLTKDGAFDWQEMTTFMPDQTFYICTLLPKKISLITGFVF